MIVVGLGGNAGGEPAVRERFVRARDALAIAAGDGGRGVRSASLYRTAPIGPAQPDYLNTAVALAWRDALPDEVLATLHEIEHLLGRDRRAEIRWGARPIDLDALWSDTLVVRRPDIEIPHPRLCERRFALLPVIDVIGGDIVVAGQSLAAHVARRADQRVELVAETW